MSQANDRHINLSHVNNIVRNDMTAKVRCALSIGHRQLVGFCRPHSLIPTKRIVKILSLPDSPIINTNSCYEIRMESPIRGRESENCAIFRQLSRCISETVRDRGIVTVVNYSKIVCPLSNQVVI